MEPVDPPCAPCAPHTVAGEPGYSEVPLAHFGRAAMRGLEGDASQAPCRPVASIRHDGARCVTTYNVTCAHGSVATEFTDRELRELSGEDATLADADAFRELIRQRHPPEFADWFVDELLASYSM